MNGRNRNLKPEWIVYAGKKRLGTKQEDALQKIIVKSVLNGIASCALYFDHLPEEAGTEDILRTGNELSILLGYPHAVSEVFSGEITAFNLQQQENGYEQMIVHGHSVLYKLDRDNHCRSYTNKDLPRGVKEIIGSYGLEAEVDQFEPKAEQIEQENVTDYDFLMNVAAQNGMMVYVKDKKVYIKRKIQLHKDGIVFEWGKKLISIESEEDFFRLVHETDAECRDAPENEKSAADSREGALKIKKRRWVDMSYDSEITDIEEEDQRAVARPLIHSFVYGSGTGTIEGNNKIFPGMRIIVKYLGGVFSGEYLVESVTHTFDYRNGYKTSFTLRRNMMPEKKKQRRNSRRNNSSEDR